MGIWQHSEPEVLPCALDELLKTTVTDALALDELGHHGFDTGLLGGFTLDHGFALPLAVHVHPTERV